MVARDGAGRRTGRAKPRQTSGTVSSARVLSGPRKKDARTKTRTCPRLKRMKQNDDDFRLDDGGPGGTASTRGQPPGRTPAATEFPEPTDPRRRRRPAVGAATADRLT